jgi:hypothetical protein
VRATILQAGLGLAVLALGACGQKAVLIDQAAPADVAPAAHATALAAAAPSSAPATEAPKAAQASAPAKAAAKPLTPPLVTAPTLPPGTAADAPLKTSTIDESNAASKEPLAISVDAPACVALGGTLPVKVTSLPDADVALLLAYEDGTTHDTQQVGTTDSAGVYSTILKVSPKAPAGPARLLVAAGSNGRGGTVEHAVRVVAATAKCN